nr:retrotransposon protein, putative, unclassified [Tanacetum cinerariifolium]
MRENVPGSRLLGLSPDTRDRMKGIKREFSIARTPQQNRETVSAQQYVLLPLWSTGSQYPQNTDDDVADVAFDVKENEADVYVFANASDKTANQKHDEKAKRDDRGKSHVDSLTGVKDLRAKFKEFSFNSTNKVNAVSALVNAVEPNSANSSNSFNTASPSVNVVNAVSALVNAVEPNSANSSNSFNTASSSVNVVSPNFGTTRKSSFVDPSNYPDDPDMPDLEDIIYSNDEEDVGAEADLSNLETNISVSPIPTTRVHKDYPVNQITGYLNAAPQTRSMTSIEEEIYVCQPLGFEDLDYPDKLYRVVKALYRLHQAPRAWYEYNRLIDKLLPKVSGKLIRIYS